MLVPFVVRLARPSVAWTSRYEVSVVLRCDHQGYHISLPARIKPKVGSMGRPSDDLPLLTEE